MIIIWNRSKPKKKKKKKNNHDQTGIKCIINIQYIT